MTCRYGPLVAALVVCLATPVAAQDGGPEGVAQEYFAVLRAEGLTAAGRFMHPDALRQFKDMMLPLFDAESKAGQRAFRDATFGLLTLDEIRALDPEAFMNGFMKIVARQTADVPLRFDKLEVVGTVPEGEQRHVLTRLTIGAGELSVTQFEVLSFIPYKDSWRLQLNGDMKGMAAALLSGLRAR